MSWLDQLLPASFNGVAFQVDSIEHQAGDNVVLREYPFQDLPTVFRMGEAAEEIKFSAYVIGDDYTEQRDALRDVLTGEGLLIHPTAGMLRVYVNGKYSIKENPSAEGGMARFDLVFVRAQERRYPTGVVNTQRTASEKAAAAKAASVDGFAASFDLAGKPGWVVDGALARLKGALAGVWGAMSGLTKDVGDWSNTAIGTYQALRDGLDDLVRQPRLLATALTGLFELPTDLTNAGARDFAAAFRGLFDLGALGLNKSDFEVSVVPAVGAGLVMFGAGSAQALTLDTPARRQLAVLNGATDQLVESVALAAWVQAVGAFEVANYDEALTLASTASAQATRLMLRASTQVASSTLPASSWHDAMAGLLSAAVGDIRGRSRDMARLTSYTPDGWESVWLTSYKLFGTPAHADEILGLNPHIEHPLLVPPGVPLRIVRHD